MSESAGLGSFFVWAGRDSVGWMANLMTTEISLQCAVCLIVVAGLCSGPVAHGQQLQNSFDGHSIFGPWPSFLDSDKIVVRPPDFEFASESMLHHDLAKEVLPGGLLYRSYIAGPNEPRFSTVANYDVSKKTWRWDSTVGARVGIFRESQPGFLNLDAWQVDVEGAAMPRLDPQQQMDVESVNYRFGLLWTAKRDNVAYKFGYFHTSSHVGDEFLLKNPAFTRVNFVRESLVLGTSVQASPALRYYGEVGWAIAATGGAKPWQFQFGAEYSPLAPVQTQGAPFSAVNIQLREEVNYAAGVTLMTGWQWKDREFGRTFRVGWQYFNGPTNQFEFLRRYDNQLGMGIWFDY